MRREKSILLALLAASLCACFPLQTILLVLAASSRYVPNQLIADLTGLVVAIVDSCVAELVPTFTPTSSPELDALLNKFRTKLFIPMSLSQQYKRIVFSPKKSETLKTNPVAVKVNPGLSDEEFILEPLTGMELRRSDTIEVLKSMKTREDWRNFIPFLIGSIRSRHPLGRAVLERAIRNAGETGNADVILEAAKRVSETGITFSNLPLAVKAFQAFRLKALEAGFKGEDLTSSLRLANQAAWLMNDPAHAQRSLGSDTPKAPFIPGLLLELSAARALDSSEGRDVDGYVRMYAKVLLRDFDVQKFQVPVNKWPKANEILWQTVCVWHGMELAKQVQEIKDDAQLTNSLTKPMEQLAKHIEKTQEAEKEYTRNGKGYGFAAAKTLYRKETS